MIKNTGVSIVIPTTCSIQRKSCLMRAINSAANQSGINVEIVVVVNGDRVDQTLFEEIKLDSRISIFYIQNGNVSKARYFGICKIHYDAFGFLDDDDELLPDTLKHRYDLLSADPELSVVVSNGYFHNTGVDRMLADDELIKKIALFPELSFLESNWFASPAPLFKKSNIDTSLFDIDYKFFEISYIFFKLIEKNYKISFSDIVAYRCYEEMAMSASKLDDCKVAYPEMIENILQLNLSRPIKKILKDKYTTGLNMVSVYYLERKQFKKAAYYHISCLLAGGLRYLLYTRKFISYQFIKKQSN